MVVKKIKAEDVVWGIDGFTDIYVTCLTGTLKKTPKKADVPNNTGGTRGYVIYEHDYSAQMEGLFKADGTIPELGDTIEVDGIIMYVMDVEEKAANNDFKKLAISAETTKSILDGAGSTLLQTTTPPTTEKNG